MDSLFDTFKARAEAVSAEVERFASRSEALQFVAALLRAENVSSIWAAGSFLNQTERAQLLRDIPGLHFDVSREIASRAKIGVSQMDWAIADTGTVVQDATSVASRLASTLPEIHVALVPTGKLLPDIATALAKMSPRAVSYVSMITGPSRTADIERVLTIGVHGPRRLIIVCIDHLEAEPA